MAWKWKILAKRSSGHETDDQRSTSIGQGNSMLMVATSGTAVVI